MESRKGRKFIKIFIFILIFASPLIGGGFLVDHLFPDDQGFSRSVLYVDNDSGGYYIIDDQIERQGQESIEVFFHVFGTRTINDTTQSASWLIGDKRLNLTVLYPQVKIEGIQGKVFKNDEISYKTHGVKITPLDSEDARIVSVFSPGNDTIHDLNITRHEGLEATNPEFIFWSINTTDIIGIPVKGDKISISRGTNQDQRIFQGNVQAFGITAKCNRLFFRLKSPGEVSEISAYGTDLTYDDGQLSSETPKNMIWDSKGKSFMYTCDDDLGLPDKIQTRSTEAPDTSEINHPFLYIEAEKKKDIESRINGSIPGPWVDWFNSISYEWSGIEDRAFKAYMEDESSESKTIIDEMLNMTQDLLPIRQNLHRGSKVFGYILAFDFLYNYMSESERNDFKAQALEITYPSADAIINNVCPNNNHKVVSLSAYGMLGLVLDDAEMISLMQEQLDLYLNHMIKRGGICFEGPSYVDYTFRYGIPFMFSLKKLGGYDYFNDPNFISLINYTLRSRAPDGNHSLFEDTHASPTLSGFMLLCANQIKHQWPDLAKNIEWYLEKYDKSSIWAGNRVNAIMMYNESGGSQAIKQPLDGSFVYFDGGMSGLGSGQAENDTMLIISNKKYYQSHAHYDESSFELWALGVKFVSNAGYPHYGSTGHSYSVSTEANNAVLIGGDPQYLIRSDGFESFSSTSTVKSIESPCFLAYEHALSISHFNWIFIFSVVFLMAVSGILIQNLSSFSRFLGGQRENLENRFNPRKESSLKKSGPIILFFLQFAGFMGIVYRMTPYLLKGIEHMEAYPDTKMLFENILWGAIVILSIATLVWLLIRRRMFSNVHDSKTKVDLAAKLAYYAIWVVMMQTLMYMALIYFPESLLTEGSTTQNAITQILYSVQGIFIVWSAMVFIRYILFIISGLKRKSIQRDIVHNIIGFSILIACVIVGVYFGQTLGIETFQSF